MRLCLPQLSYVIFHKIADLFHLQRGAVLTNTRHFDNAGCVIATRKVRVVTRHLVAWLLGI